MQYWEIVKKSFKNAWDYKFLWLFGYFVAAADNGGSVYNWTDIMDSQKFMERNTRISDALQALPFDINPYLIGYLFVLLLCIGVIFWLFSVFSEGGLIYGIAKKEQNLTTGFMECWSESLNKFFRLFGITAVATIITIAIVLFMALAIIPSFFISVGLGIVLVFFGLIVLIPILIAIVCIQGWAIRYAVLYNTNWFDSIGRGWSLFAGNFGPTLGIAFSSMLSQIVVNIALVFGIILIAIPFIILGIINLWMGIIPGVITFLIIATIFSCYIGTFSSSVWTIGFMRLTGYAEPPAQ
ncbi:MAG: hypothetical protein ABIJ45_07060 [Candidatus Zixiibacteriota bacterium]